MLKEYKYFKPIFWNSESDRPWTFPGAILVITKKFGQIGSQKNLTKNYQNYRRNKNCTTSGPVLYLNTIVKLEILLSHNFP